MKSKIRLGVNIDHVATVRNARGGKFPCPVRAALLAESVGAEGITAHLREDRRHINDKDIFALKSKISLPLNMEMAATDEMLSVALKVKPNACCIVPEKREEVTTEGGLDVVGNLDNLTKISAQLKKAGIKVSLFIDPEEAQIEASAKVGADIVELHTGKYCHLLGGARQGELQKIIKACAIVSKHNIECHAGHGLDYDTVADIAKIPNIVELNIGHFLMGESIFVGMEQAVKKMKSIIDANSTCS